MSNTEKKKLVFQTRSRVVTLPEFVDQDVDDSEDEDYEPSSESESEQDHSNNSNKRKNNQNDNSSNKKRVIDLDTEVINLDDDDDDDDNNKDKDNNKVISVDDMWKEMNKDEEVKEVTTPIVQTPPPTTTTTTTTTNTDTNEITATTTNTTSTTTSTTTTTTTENKKDEEKVKAIEKKEETEVVEFAGEKIEVKKTSSPLPPKPMVSKSKKGGLDSLLSGLSKPKKINTLEKSKLDWDKFKDQDETEKHIIEQQKKDGYLERKSFLDKANSGTL